MGDKSIFRMARLILAALLLPAALTFSDVDLSSSCFLPDCLDKEMGLSKLNGPTKERLVNNLKTDLARFQAHEKAAERQVSKFVNGGGRKSEKLARKGRLVSMVIDSVQRTLDNEETDRMVSQSGKLDEFLSGLDKLCDEPVSEEDQRTKCKVRSDEFRQFDGECNNLDHPSWGKAAILMRRMVTPAYADGGSQPRAVSKSPRQVSDRLHNTTDSEKMSSVQATHMVMQFGQFLDHDITLTPVAELTCCEPGFLFIDRLQPENMQRCLNLEIDGQCIPFTRSDTYCTGGQSVGRVEKAKAHREQMNAVTAFVDGSQIYGSDFATAYGLRAPPAPGARHGARLLTNSEFDDVEILPQRSQCPFFFSTGNPSGLIAGDVRAAEQPGLASIQTLFLNEHNRIVEGLRPHAEAVDMDQDVREVLLYQLARQLVGAELQQIVYREYLPVVLGQSALGDLASTETVYNPDVDPSIRNEFAAVAYRFGHSSVSDTFQGAFAWPLSFHFLDSLDTDSDFFVRGDSGTNWMHEMVGAANQLAPAADLEVGDALRNQLREFVSGHPDDLVARNIQRAREHGIPSYMKLRQAVLGAAETNERPAEIDPSTWDRLLAVYGNSDDIDAFTGGLAEQSQDGGMVGPLFAEIIRRQFELLRDGDRFFFTHKEDPSTKARGLGPVAKSAILKRTLGAVLCDVIPQDIITTKPIGQSVFKFQDSHENPVLDCSSVAKMDFKGIFEESMGMKIRPECEASMNVGRWYGNDGNPVEGMEGGMQTDGPLDCARHCKDEPACKGWDLHVNSNWCWLMKTKVTSGSQEGWVAGLPC